MSLMKRRKSPGIKLAELERLRQAGLSVTEMANALGVTKGAVSKALARTNTEAQKQIVLGDAELIVQSRVNMADQILSINDQVTKLLESFIKRMEALLLSDKKLSLKDSAAVVIKAISEIRAQIQLSVNISQGLFEMEEIRAFQREVLDVIGKVSPEARKQIIERLKERRFSRTALGKPGSGVLGGPDGGADRDMGPDDPAAGEPFHIQGSRVSAGDPDEPASEGSLEEGLPDGDIGG